MYELYTNKQRLRSYLRAVKSDYLENIINVHCLQRADKNDSSGLEMQQRWCIVILNILGCWMIRTEQ